MAQVETGLDVLREGYWKQLKGQRLGLLFNPASLDNRLRTAKEVISELLPGQLKALFGPQHGHAAEDQDNMIETAHSQDGELHIPIFSLYSQVRKPTKQMLDLFDTLIIDLQDVGTRVYTFASTVLNCLKASSEAGKKVIILDRPNPVGGERVEGNLLKPDFYSFVGPFTLPMRHGLTMGEMGLLFNHALKVSADLNVIPMKGWRRRMLWPETGLKWMMPSPNMPLPETAGVYPGQVIWEGTNLSEGRGTCRPFEIFGAPFLNSKKVRDVLPAESTEGCYLQDISFRPTFHKWAGEICRGFMVHILNPSTYRPYYTALSILRILLDHYPEQFQWKAPPYEYEFERLPIDMILGDDLVRKKLEKGEAASPLNDSWINELKDYLGWRESYLLYD
ncbi:MAG: DUF1343 domain-containing protein [Deltaproteobacteria bacterium]|nr:DUF1343 domain-containing protein [Deltaproteobacteria bacterium]